MTNNKKFTIKDILEYNKLYKANSKKTSELLSIINKKIKSKNGTA